MKLFIYKKYLIIVFFILLFAAFLRFYQLGAIPAGLTADEADTGYDAFSIYQTQRDQWDNTFPLVSFKGFGDYRPPTYTYLVAFQIPIFGLTPLAIRFPSAVFGLISIMLTYLILKKFFSEQVGVVGTLLFAISPWAIGLSRVGVESNVAATLVLAAIYSFTYSQKRIFYFYLSIVFLATSIYTYSGYTLLAPLILLVLIIFYFKFFKSNIKSVAIGLILFSILCLPIFMQQNASAKIRFSQVNFLQDITSVGIINKLNDQRGECLKVYHPLVCRLTINKVNTFSSTFVANYISHFSPEFLYIKGNEGQFSILPQRGLLYIFDFFLFISGLIWIIQKRSREGFFILIYLLISPIPDTLTGGGHYSRAFSMLPPMIFIESLGLINISSLFIFKKYKNLNTAFLILSSIGIIFSCAIFFMMYTTFYRVHYSRFSSYGYEELMKHVYAVRKNYSRIYISSRLNEDRQYIYYLLYNKYDPVKYQNKIDVSYTQSSDGWINIERIDNVYFVPTLSAINLKDRTLIENTLLISAPVDLPEALTPIKSIKDLKKDTLFEAINAKDLFNITEEVTR